MQETDDMKKIWGIVLALCLVFALAADAFAAGKPAFTLNDTSFLAYRSSIMADENDVTYNPTKVVAQMNEFVGAYSKYAIKLGDSFYKFSYNFSISWTSPMAKSYEEMMRHYADFVEDGVKDVNFFIDLYEDGIAELTGVNEAPALIFPHVPEIHTELFPMSEADSDGNVGIDKELAMTSKDEYMADFTEYALSLATISIDVGIMDEDVRESAKGFMQMIVEGFPEDIQGWNNTLTRLLEEETGKIDTSEKMSYEALIEMASSMDTIPDDMPELKICKNWLNTKKELTENVEKIKMETLGPDADKIMKELLHPDEITDESSDSNGETAQEEAADSSNSLPKPTSMPAKASLDNKIASTLER